MKIWLGKAESCSARSSCTQTLSKPLETKEVRGACSFTDCSVIAKTHIMTIRSTEPGSWFHIQCPFTSLKPHHLPRSASGKSLCQSSQIEFQHFPYRGKISFPHASSHNSLSVIKLVLPGAVSFSDGISQIFISLEFLSLLHLVSMPGLWLPAFTTDWHEGYPEQRFLWSDPHFWFPFCISHE